MVSARCQKRNLVPLRVCYHRSLEVPCAVDMLELSQADNCIVFPEMVGEVFALANHNIERIPRGLPRGMGP